VTATRIQPTLLPTLRGPTYADPDIFELEQERIFAGLWNCVLRASELGGPGAYRTVTLAGESVIVTRDSEGAVRAFINVCRHRGARLCPAEAGEVRRGFRCGYHAWTYGLDGALIAAPNLASMPDIDRQAHGLVPVAVQEWLGYVWLCLAAEPPDFAAAVVAQVTDRLGDPDAIGSYAVADLALGRRITYDVAANWKLIVENFMECYHCATIHPELTDVLPEFRQGFAAQYFVGHGAAFAEGVEGFTFDGRPGFGRLEGLKDDQDRRYFALTVRPQVFVNLVPDHVILHRLTPLAADRTVVHCDWLYAPSVVASGADVDASVELFDRVNRQDFEACESCQSTTGSRAYAAGGVLVPSEHHIADFHAWVRSLVGEALR
jgi:glycine betaine catabolism A